MSRPSSAPPWLVLLASDTALSSRRLPPPLNDVVGEHSEGARRALVLWGPERGDLAGADEFNELVLVRPHGIRDADLHRLGFRFVRRYAVLPRFAVVAHLALDKRERAQWVLPLDASSVAASALRALYTPYRWRARVRAVAARSALVTGAARFMFDELCIAYRDTPPLERALQELLGIRVRLAVASTGWGQRATTTVAVLALNGAPQAFVKLPGTELARTRLRHEALVLRRLAESGAMAALAPRVLFEGDLDGRYATVQAAVNGVPAHADVRRPHFAFLEKLGSGTFRTASECGHVRSLQLRLAAGTPRSELVTALELLRSILDEVTLPVTVTHGDFFPSNLRIDRGGMVAFDWEDAELDSLPLLDLIHHELEVGTLLRDWPVRRAYEELEHLLARQAQLKQRHAEALLGVHLLDTYLRRLEGGHSEHGGAADRYLELLRLTTRSLAAGELRAQTRARIPSAAS